MATPSARFFTRRSISAPVIALLGFTLVLAAQHVLQASRSVPQKAAAPAQPAAASYTTVTPKPAMSNAPSNVSRSSSTPDASAATAAEPLPRRVKQWMEPRWMVQGELKKAGAGILFFAYSGSPAALRRVVLEAERAGRSFRVNNPGISLAVVSNNASIDYQIFDTHVVARDDLIFAGADAPTAGERGLRQRLTRIYYLAQSPYELTWALDSDALSCTPHAAQAFLSDALENRLWDFSIAHASQRLGREERMYPHSGNIVFRWREETSALLRDWFMLQLRQGVASDDEKSLHLAELRLSRRYGTSKFKIGRITPELGARLYTVAETANGITPVLHGPVHVLHGADQSLCAAFNSDANRARQILHTEKSSYKSLTSIPECVAALGQSLTVVAGAQYCLIGSRYAAEYGSGGASPPPPAYSQRYISQAKVESYLDYVRSPRCGTLCANGDALEDVKGKWLPNSQARQLKYTPCRPFEGMQLARLRLNHERSDSMMCRGEELLSMFKLTYEKCTRPTMMRFAFDCAKHVAMSQVRFSDHSYLPNCGAPTSIDRLAELNISCPSGFALSELTLHPGLCSVREVKTKPKPELSFFRTCSSVTGHVAVDPRPRAADAPKVGIRVQVQNAVLPRLPYFTSETLCSKIADQTYEALEPHVVSCGPRHALSSIRLTADGCTVPGSMHFVFTCIGIGVVPARVV